MGRGTAVLPVALCPSTARFALAGEACPQSLAAPRISLQAETMRLVLFLEEASHLLLPVLTLLFRLLEISFF